MHLVLATLACHSSPPCAGRLAFEPTWATAPGELVVSDAMRSSPERVSLEAVGPGVAAADLDGDGAVDLAVAWPSGPSLVLRGLGDGTFEAVDPVVLPDGALPGANGVAAADLDDDGHVDLVLATGADDPDQVLWNLSDFTFQREELPGQGGLSTTPSTFDADGDGDLDLVVGRYARFRSSLEVVAGDVAGDGTLLLLQQGGTWVDASDRLDAAHRDDLTFHAAPLDADADGDLDLYLANDFGAYVDPAVLLVNQGGAFQAVSCGCSVAAEIMGVAVGDPSADGLPDLVLTDIGRVHLFLGLGQGAFLDASAPSGLGPLEGTSTQVAWAATLTDFDGDGWEELAATLGPVNPGATDDQGEPIRQADRLWRGGPDGFIPADAGFHDTGANRGLAVADVDADRRPDVVVVGFDGVRVFRNVGGCPQRAVTGAVGSSVAWEGGQRWLLPSTLFGSSEPVVWLPDEDQGGPG